MCNITLVIVFILVLLYFSNMFCYSNIGYMDEPEISLSYIVKKCNEQIELLNKLSTNPLDTDIAQFIINTDTINRVINNKRLVDNTRLPIVSIDCKIKLNQVKNNNLFSYNLSFTSWNSGDKKNPNKQNIDNMKKQLQEIINLFKDC